MSGNTRPLTVQCTPFANGDVLVVLKDIQGFNAPGFGAPQDNGLVGISSGNTVFGPSPLDLSAIAAGTPQVGAPPFELFSNGPTDLASNVPYLAALSRPASGNRFDLQLFDAPTNTLLG